MISTSTAYDILYNALQICGVISYGESIDPAISKTGLQILNGLRAEWSEKYINYKKYDEFYTTPTNVYSISLGTSGTISARPIEIDEVIISFNTNNYQIPVKSYDEYRHLTITNIYSLPAAAYIDNEYPQRNIYFFPGLAAGYSVRILGRSYLPEYENITDTFIDPPEMFQCLIYALALKLAPMFGTDSASMVNVQQMLHSALKPLKSNNFKTRMQRAKNDLIGASGNFNLLAGF